MTDTPGRTPDHPGPPAVPFLAVAAALAAIDQAVHTAQDRTAAAIAPEARGETPSRVEEALAALLLLRELRGHLAAWEPDLIETARDAGASWAALAEPLGVTSRQAAERRYLRLRPGGAPGTTGDQRVQATRDRRAADRAVTTWARDHAAELRALAGATAALDDLGRLAAPPLAALTDALGHDDPAHLLAPLADIGPHLAAHPALAAKVTDLTDRAAAIRNASDLQRRT
ncbi:type III effector protein [Streptodolium elevatio]|uniref:Type III effector protein n=1 Tax=Streptodolium elevatio TaxID=3157996 RepID=A0ABV3DVL7_9ACTN